MAHPPYYLTTNAFAACQPRRSLALTTTPHQYSTKEVWVRRPVTKAGAHPVAHPPYCLTTNAFAACKDQRGQPPEGRPRKRTWREC